MRCVTRLIPCGLVRYNLLYVRFLLRQGTKICCEITPRVVCVCVCVLICYPRVVNDPNGKAARSAEWMGEESVDIGLDWSSARVRGRWNKGEILHVSWERWINWISHIVYSEGLGLQRWAVVAVQLRIRMMCQVSRHIMCMTTSPSFGCYPTEYGNTILGRSMQSEWCAA